MQVKMHHEKYLNLQLKLTRLFIYVMDLKRNNETAEKVLFMLLPFIEMQALLRIVFTVLHLDQCLHEDGDK